MLYEELRQFDIEGDLLGESAKGNKVLAKLEEIKIEKQ
jgi:hypothetical protein